jgi:Pyruvate/2-oxoacid:ferredoxin oxidoreductase delta subunit
MNISRKEFLRKSLFSLGELTCTAAGLLKDPTAVKSAEESDQDLIPIADDNRHAVAHNERCLAGSCGCFVCVERCEPAAIKVVMGEGISIDTARCTGCGTCNFVCPVYPKAVSMVASRLHAIFARPSIAKSST